MTAKTILSTRYCIVGFQYNEPMKQSEFYKGVKYGLLQTTDEWDEVKFYQSLEEAEFDKLCLKHDFPDYGWYVLIFN